MTLDEITEKLRGRIGEDSGLGATLKFDFGPDGKIFVDATQVPNVVSNEDAEAQCTLEISRDDFLALAQGELDGMTAFMTGRLKIQGDMGIAMQLPKVLRG